MDMSHIIQVGAQLFQSKLDADGDGQVEISDIVPALSNLLSDAGGQLDLGSIVSKMSSGDLMSTVTSWLGDGENAAVSGSQVTEILGQDKVAAFAQQLGLSEDKAVQGLQEAIPAVIDKSSSGGSILDSIGGISGAMGMASKLFGR